MAGVTQALCALRLTFFMKSSSPTSPNVARRAQPSKHRRTCLNCGAELMGPYCAQCGQEATERNVPLRVLLKEVLDTLFSLDARLFQTTRQLLVKPGYLTNEYIAGRRIRYVSPLRLYLFTSFVFFLLLATLDDLPMQNAGEAQATARQERAAEAVQQLPPWLREGNAAAAPSDTLTFGGGPIDTLVVGSSESSGLLGRVLQRKIRRISEEPGSFASSLRDQMSIFVFALIPVFALLLKLMYVRSGRLYIQHFVFSLHVHAFVFILFSCVWLIDALGSEGFQKLADTLYLWGVLLYLLLAMRRVYGQSLWKTILKVGGLLMTYLIVFVLAFAGFALLTILLF